jgi:peptidyl-prolyl cis-trans isomerase A (cyclophilin A)
MHAILHTSLGDIKLNLFPESAPNTVANFTGLADGSKPVKDPRPDRAAGQGFYDGTIFHRVIDGFMIQGGDPLGTGTGGPGYDFDDEIDPDRKFDRPYLLAMANAGLRMGKGTNGSQFFISVVPTPHLTGKHTIFGEVADPESRQVVDAIATTKTDRTDRPLQAIQIERVTIEQ